MSEAAIGILVPQVIIDMSTTNGYLLYGGSRADYVYKLRGYTQFQVIRSYSQELTLVTTEFFIAHTRCTPFMSVGRIVDENEDESVINLS